MLVGWAAIWGAMHLQLTQVDKAIADIKTDLVDHRKSEGHPLLT